MKTGLSAVPRRWRIVLLVSLALNVAVLGTVLGTTLDRHGPGRGAARAPGPVEPLVLALPEEDRRAVIGAFRESRPDAKSPPPKGGPNRFETLLDAIRAEPFEPDAVLTQLQAQRQRAGDRMDRAEVALVARLSQMSPEARRDYARTLRENVRRR